MKTLLCIDSYAAISDFLPAMWPHYEKAGCDIVGANRTNAPTTWPKDIPTIAYGEDIFQRWCDHKSPTLLNDRALGMIEALLHDERFIGYSDFCLTMWSVVFCKPLPNPMPAPLVLNRTGLAMRDRGFKASGFFHMPWWFDRPTGEKIASVGRDLMAHGENEFGSSDFFFGLILDRAGLKWHEVPAYSVNGFDHPDFVRNAREWMAKGAWWVGNAKNRDQLNALMAF